MAAADAQMYWMSAKIPNDQFLLYCFDTGSSHTASPHIDDIAADLRIRAASVPDLLLKIRPVPFGLDYPSWVPKAVSVDDVVVASRASTWDECRAGVEKLLVTAVDATRSPWRVHLFGAVTGAPRCDGSALVAVVQISHALADGQGTAAITRALFGSSSIAPVRRGSLVPRIVLLPNLIRVLAQVPSLVVRGRRAAVESARLIDDTEAGRVPAPAPGRAPVAVNARPGGARRIAMIVCDRDDFGSTSVTVAALTVVSLALQRYLADRGNGAKDLAAETTIATRRRMNSRNNFANAGVDLHIGERNLVRRAAAIASSLDDRRRRLAHPSFAAGSVATAAVPALLMRWGVAQFDIDVVPETVTGNTVLSSVNRGAADLMLAGAPVRFTAGFPGLSPMMGLTHGVHGIGRVVTISVTTSPAVMPDVEDYVQSLRRALAEVARALG